MKTQIHPDQLLGNGLTVRAFIASQVLTGIVSNPISRRGLKQEEVAERAVSMADDLIKALNEAES